MIPAAFYGRESADESYSSGASIPGQRKAVHSWAEKNGYALVSKYVDEHLKGWDPTRAGHSFIPGTRFQGVDLCYHTYSERLI
jgi:hypothetical protein